MRSVGLAVCVGLVIGSASVAVAGDFASEVVSYSLLGAAPHDYPGAALGKPTTKFYEMGNPSKVFETSLAAAPYNLSPDYDPANPNAGKVIVTVKTGGQLTVKFDAPIEDDPQNWYGKDFIIFGNSAFNGSGLVPGQYIEPGTDLEEYWLDAYGGGRWEPMVVSVSQYADGPWFSYTNGPFADDFAPTQAYAWDYLKHTWGPEMDFTKPVDPSLGKASFEAKMVGEAMIPLTAAEAVDMYEGSGGGTAFDLSGLSLPVNASGRKWIQYIKITGKGGEIDAFSRVSHAAEPVNIGQAKKLPDGARVTLTEQIVSAGTDALGDCCYVQAVDRSAGIKVTGRRVDSGKRVIVHGVMATSAGEREIRATCMEISSNE